MAPPPLAVLAEQVVMELQVAQAHPVLLWVTQVLMEVVGQVVTEVVVL
jgi:hypothetical protein